MVLDLEDFTSQQTLSFGYVLGSKLNPLGHGLNYSKQRLKFGCHKFLSISKFEMSVYEI